MRDRTKRFAVAVAGLAIAAGTVLASAPAADAATVTGRTTATAAHDRDDHRWGRDDDDRRWGRSHGEHRRHWKKHWKKRSHWEGRRHHRHRHQWRNHGHYGSYHEAYLIGQRYRGSSWESFRCERSGGAWVLRVYA
ncbi:hypothetical protein [Cryptosporangium japonicum]|uniref:Secreted protein n=1 Tax=Cryptosporangium japonicum TaxID=80872 RepID=A0ABP3E999_9ACTN